MPQPKDPKKYKEYIAKLKQSHLGYKMPESQKQKIREASIRNGNKPPSPKGKRLSEETKRKMSESKRGEKSYRWNGGKAKCIDCGKETFNKAKRCWECYLKFNKGSNHWAWKGGKTPEYVKIRQSKEMKLWRKAVFERDMFTCQKYGTKGGKLNPHHIHNFADYPELRFAIDNGITLSEEAHKEFHKIYGKKNNTIEQLEEFIIN